MLSRCSKHVVLLLALLFSHQSFAEGDRERGKVLAETCEGCHAVATYNNVYPTYHVPRIVGQSEVYLSNALSAYGNGERSHATMIAQAASLSDQDIDDIAAYIAGINPVSDDVSVNGTAPGKASTCAACHGPAGRSPIPENPTLAGQHQDYLLQSLQQYKDGGRTGSNAVVMQAQIAMLTDDELTAVAAFYARQSGLMILPDD
jgi:cytochrome c553